MSKPEKLFWGWLQKHILDIAVILAVFVSYVIRLLLFSYHTLDMDHFLLPWVEVFRQRGFEALGLGVGNYNVLYQLILSLIAKLPFSSVFAIKLVSVIFDYVLAVVVAYMVYLLRGIHPNATRIRWGKLAFIVTVLLPLPILNSALWGQCDSIYASFALLALVCLVREKNIAAFIWLGISFCFKLQAIFLLPVFIIVYVANKKINILSFFIPPVLLFASTLPAILYGASPFVGFTTYFGQLSTDERFYISYPGVSALVQVEMYDYFAKATIIAAILVFFFMLAWTIYQKITFEGEKLVLLAAWSVFTCVLLLPTMHERYAYVGEVLLWAWFLSSPRWKRFGVAAFFTLSGYCSYAYYLFGWWPISVEMLTVASFAVYAWLTWQLIKPANEHTQYMISGQQNRESMYVTEDIVQKEK